MDCRLTTVSVRLRPKLYEKLQTNQLLDTGCVVHHYNQNNSITDGPVMENFNPSVSSFCEVEIVKLQMHMCKSENGTGNHPVVKWTSVRLNLAICLIFIGGEIE